VPDEVRVVCTCLLEESLEVVGRHPRLTLVVVHSSRDAPHARAARLFRCCHRHS
jgi:hypothetical protein